MQRGSVFCYLIAANDIFSLQVDVVKKYKETELLIQTLHSEPFPNPEIDNDVYLEKTG